MAIAADRKGLKTAVNVASGRGSRENPVNNSSARKYVTKGSVQNPSSEVGSADSKYVSSLIESTVSSVEIAVQAARVARENLQNSRSTNEQPTDVTSLPSQISAALGKSSIDAKVSETLSKGVSNAFKQQVQADIPTKKLSDVPKISKAHVDLDSHSGTIDSFFVELSFVVPLVDLRMGNIKAFRVFRASSTNAALQNRLPVLTHMGLQRLESLSLRTHLVNHDTTSAIQNKYDELSVPNAVSQLTPVDSILGLRTSATDLSSRVNTTSSLSVHGRTSPQTKAAVAAFLDLGSSPSLDLSVANDPKSLRNIQLQNPGTVSSVSTGPISVGKNAPPRSSMALGQEQLRQQTSALSDPSGLSTNDSKSAGFKEIGFFSPSKISFVTIGDLAEFTFVDRSVTFGNSYQYYVLCVDPEIAETNRSSTAEVVIDGLRNPLPPRFVSTTLVNGWVAFNARCDDRLVEKYEFYRRIDEPGQFERPLDSIPALGVNGFISSNKPSIVAPSGFVQVGEAVNDSYGGCVFYDRGISQARKYIYRVYTVDIFGNRSDSPFELSFFSPDIHSKRISLAPPVIDLEIDGKTNFARVNIRCFDPNVRTLRLSRRDLTIGQMAFVVPSSPSLIRLGSTDSARGNFISEDPRIYDKLADSSWNGTITNDPTKATVFIDKDVQSDHIYQYSAKGFDRFGNETDSSFSNRLMIVRRPFIEPPINVRVELSSSRESLFGVNLNWDDGNVDVSADDMLGSQGKLQDTSVRTLFQVERRKDGSSIWEKFSLGSEKNLFDPIQSDGLENPPFRPPFVQEGITYYYRVQAIQTGVFISNFSSEASILVESIPDLPEYFRAIPSPKNVSPIYVNLTWTNSGSILDRWEIQRSVINNFAASTLNPMAPQEMSSLSFSDLKNVYTDVQISSDSVIDAGCRDYDVSLGNSYFYRIRSVTPKGTTSAWVYRGVMLTDQVFEQKLLGTLTQQEKDAMLNSLSPMNLRGIQSNGKNSNFSMNSLVNK